MSLKSHFRYFLPQIPEPRHIFKRPSDVHVSHTVILSDSKHYWVSIQRPLIPSMRSTCRDIHHLGLEGYFDEYNYHDCLQAYLIVEMGHSL